MTSQNGKPRTKFGVPTGRFLELSLKTRQPEAYEITDQLSICAPTKKRREQMRDAERRMVVGQAQLNIAYALSRTPAPPMPQQLAPSTPLPDEQAAAAAAAFNHEIERWKQETRQWRDNLTEAQTSITKYTEQVAAADIDYDKAFFGVVYDDVVAFFDQQPEALWDEFRIDLSKHWLPSQPDDGTCPTCGQIADEDEAGKAIRSLTG